MHALDESLRGQLLDVAPHRHVRDAELVDELGHSHGATVLDEAENRGTALAGEH